MTTFIGTVNDHGFMNQENASTFYGTAYDYFSVGERNDAVSLNRSVLKCTQLDSIPTTSTINSATLQITVAYDLSNNARTLSAYRIKRAWSGSVSWNKYDPSNNWGTAGCGDIVNDRDSAAIGTAPVAAAVAIGSVISITLDASLVQDWTSGVMTNNGVLLQVSGESSDCVNYVSNGETGSSSYWPKWIIDYTDSGVSSGYTLILNT